MNRAHSACQTHESVGGTQPVAGGLWTRSGQYARRHPGRRIPPAPPPRPADAQQRVHRHDGQAAPRPKRPRSSIRSASCKPSPTRRSTSPARASRRRSPTRASKKARMWCSTIATPRAMCRRRAAWPRSSCRTRWTRSSPSAPRPARPRWPPPRTPRRSRSSSARWPTPTGPGWPGRKRAIPSPPTRPPTPIM